MARCDVLTQVPKKNLKDKSKGSKASHAAFFDIKCEKKQVEGKIKVEEKEDKNNQVKLELNLLYLPKQVGETLLFLVGKVNLVY